MRLKHQSAWLMRNGIYSELMRNGIYSELMNTETILAQV